MELVRSVVPSISRQKCIKSFYRQLNVGGISIAVEAHLVDVCYGRITALHAEVLDAMLHLKTTTLTPGRGVCGAVRLTLQYRLI